MLRIRYLRAQLESDHAVHKDAMATFAREFNSFLNKLPEEQKEVIISATTPPPKQEHSEDVTKNSDKEAKEEAPTSSAIKPQSELIKSNSMTNQPFL